MRPTTQDLLKLRDGEPVSAALVAELDDSAVRQEVARMEQVRRELRALEQRRVASASFQHEIKLQPTRIQTLVLTPRLTRLLRERDRIVLSEPRVSERFQERTPRLSHELRLFEPEPKGGAHCTPPDSVCARE